MSACELLVVSETKYLRKSSVLLHPSPKFMLSSFCRLPFYTMSSEATLMKSASMEKDSETCLLRTESAMSTRPYSQSTILQLEADGLKFVNPGEIAWTECHSLHPRNWPWRRKIYDTGVMFCFEFLTTLVSNTGVCLVLSAEILILTSRSPRLLLQFIQTGTFLENKPLSLSHQPISSLKQSAH